MKDYVRACRTRRLYAVWLREQGKTLNEIADVMHCSKQRVYAMLKQEAL